jgi:hypothetical protein
MRGLVILTGLALLSFVAFGFWIRIREKAPPCTTGLFALAVLWMPFYAVGLKGVLQLVGDGGSICLSPLLWMPTFWTESLISFAWVAVVVLGCHGRLTQRGRDAAIFMVLCVLFGGIGAARWSRAHNILAAGHVSSPSGQLAALRLHEAGFADSTDTVILFATDARAWQAKRVTGFGYVMEIKWIERPERLVVKSTHAYETSDEAVYESTFDARGVKLHRTIIQHRDQNER